MEWNTIVGKMKLVTLHQQVVCMQACLSELEDCADKTELRILRDFITDHNVPLRTRVYNFALFVAQYGESVDSVIKSQIDAWRW